MYVKLKLLKMTTDPPTHGHECSNPCLSSNSSMATSKTAMLLWIHILKVFKLRVLAKQIAINAGGMDTYRGEHYIYSDPHPSVLKLE